MDQKVKAKSTVTLRAKAACPSHSRSEVSIRDLTCAIDEPLERGGSNNGPTPTDAALSTLIGCTNVIGHECAKSLGIEIGKLSIEAACDFDRRGVTLQDEIEVPFVHINLRIETGVPVAEADLTRLSTEVAKFCPLSKLFKQAGTTIDEEWVSAPAT